MIRTIILAVVSCAAVGAPAGAQPPPAGESATATAEQLSFFEQRIRPVLVKECYGCHAADAKEIQGGLTLDTRAGIQAGGERGPAVVPGDPRKSLLIQAIRQVDKDLAMPPDKKLPAEVIADFEKWVSMGAPDPREGAAKVVRQTIDIQKGREYWAFQRPVATSPPPVRDVAWPRTAIDHYLLAAMEARDVRPVADADASTLVRRIWFDLTGLPPSAGAVAEFSERHAHDPDSAIGELVDALLASPAFGQRWGRHWLDVARYAESSGRSVNFAYPHAWRYRDYVIQAFNADKPYDQFVREQLAGDLLLAKDDQQRGEFLVATGFLAIGAKAHDQRDPRQFQLDLVDEQIDATFQAFQALTVACARCHDHKFDPVPQKDYYALAGIFRSTETCYGTLRIFQSNHPSALISLPSGAHAPTALEPLTDSRRESLEKQIKDLREQAAKLTGSDTFIQRILIGSRAVTLNSQLEQFTTDGTPRSLAMGARDARFPGDARLLVRGELDQPGDRVRRGVPQVLSAEPLEVRRGSGRRELAEWIASPRNPLTARVMVNRIWLHLIGRGLVATPDNFGAAGMRPTHPELLDHLAQQLMAAEWSVKAVIRQVTNSRAYRLSSWLDEKNYESDPDNLLVWRMPKRRLEAEALRDAMLQVSGQLDTRVARGSSVARGGEGNVGGPFRGFGRSGDSGAGESFRSVYLPIVRDALPESLTLFDFPDPTLIMGERATTTVPAQSLYLLNNPFVLRMADAFAERLLAEQASDDERVRQAYEACFSRSASAAEVARALEFVAEYGRRRTPRTTWSALCQALLASAEFAQR